MKLETELAVRLALHHVRADETIDPKMKLALLQAMNPNPRLSDQPRRIKLADAAARLGVNVRTVRRYIEKGILQGTRIGVRTLAVWEDELARLQVNRKGPEQG